MRYLEQFVTHLLNENEEKAVSLLRKHIIDRAREIHESLRQDDDAVLSEGWDDSAMSETYFNEGDLDDAVISDEGAEGADPEDALSDDLGMDGDGDADMDGDMDADMDMDSDLDGSADDMGSEPADDLADEVADMKATLDRLVGELDEFLHNGADKGSDDEEMATPDDMAPADSGSDYMDDGEDDALPDDDMMKESSDEFDDISESIIAELEKVSVPNTDGRLQGDTNKVAQNTKSASSAREKKAAPIVTKRDDHVGFARETEPKSADRKRYRNNNPTADAGRSKVSKEGDASAELNKAKSNPTAKSIIGGK